MRDMQTEKFMEAKLVEIQKHCDKHRISLSVFGERVCNTAELVRRLKGKGNVTIATLRKIDAYLQEHK